ncbi:protease inhibitor Inh [Pseudomonas fluorescens]|uniref:Protease inhibitor Inh n=1 Tax=Pseudomonas fluorescens TaxID=294 RepID=A0A379IE72_PSEFL|nr:AprI/Inh family metalloprotease inhibitor [Pseudomonas fluorescens]AIG01288.1 hypothetical protein HZ99_03540 [Pseudomonas fluorescens]SUD31041.1 protease inhibitor Inh [Pseudomonas fluorescens]
MQAKRAWALLAALALIDLPGESAMASTLRMPRFEELEGQWRVYLQQEQDQTCTLALHARSRAVEGELACAAHWLGGMPAAWEPTPDGINVYSGDGRRLMHFGRQPENIYLGRLPAGGFLVLERIVPTRSTLAPSS